MRDPDRPAATRVPLVSELLDRLVFEMPAQARNRSSLFQVALQVCTEELRLTKQGQPPATMDVLVERAKLVITGAVRPRAAADDAAGRTAPSTPGTSPTSGPGRAAGRPASPADSPATDQGAPATTSDRAPTRPPSDTPFGAMAPTPPVAPTFDGPFDTALLPPPLPPTPRHAPTFEEILERQLALESHERRKRQSRTSWRPSPMFVAAVVAVVVLAAAAVLFLSPWRVAGAGGEHLSAAARPAVNRRPTAPPAPAPTAPPSAAPIVAAAPTQAATALPTRAPEPTPVPPTPRPTRARTRPTPEAGSIELPEPVPARLQEQRRIAAMTSPDWRGKPPAFVIHFSSYRNRALADADGRELAARYRRPAHAVAVDLGQEGRWWRVLLAGFATAEEALAFRAELAARNTPELGHVFRIEGQP